MHNTDFNCKYITDDEEEGTTIYKNSMAFGCVIFYTNLPTKCQ
jgi:hypothetical protein